MNKKLIFLFCTTVIFLIRGALPEQAFGQTKLAYVPTITPTAPDAAALMKFTDIPVSPYTGSSSVTVPIYTIKVRGVTIPISIDYHTGGIRLEEEASNVGLGWALSANCMISRSINDKDDLGGLYFGQPVPQKQGNLIGYQPANDPFSDPGMDGLDSVASYNCPTCNIFPNCPTCPVNGNRYIFEFNCSYQVNFTGGSDTYDQVFETTGDDHIYDLEPDTYSFNFLGYSGKFIILRDKHTVVLQKQDNINIKVLQPGPTAASIVFVITDEHGNNFYFNTIQTTNPAWQPASTPTSWYLSKIVPQLGDSIVFNYNGTNITNPHPYTYVAAENSKSYVLYGSNVGPQLGTSTGTYYNNVNLQSIDYPDGQLQFYSDGNREDLNGGIKLDSIRVYSKTTKGLNYLKSDKFYYTYFNAHSADTAAWELERLKLDSVKEFSGGNALRPYSFTYWPAPTLSGYGQKHSYAIDHWGYYNGAGNSDLIPTTSVYYSNEYNTVPTLLTYNGGNREPSFPSSESFAMIQATYPTGGYSIFNYEPNTYDYNNSTSKQLDYPAQVFIETDTSFNIGATTSGVVDFSKIYPVIPPGVSGTNARVNIAFICSRDSGWTAADRNQIGQLSFTFNTSTTDLSSSFLTCPVGQRNCSYEYPFTVNPFINGTLPWSAYYNPGAFPPGELSLIRVQFFFKSLEIVAHSNPTLTAGGLRIQSITDYSASGAVAKKRTWNYSYGSTGQYTYGKLMSFPSYVRQEEQYYPSGGGQIPSLVLFGSSITGTTSSASGNIVGYSQVTETTVDPSNNDNGKIVYKYINDPDSVISYNNLRPPGVPNISSNLNGSQLSRTVYRNNAGAYLKVAETDNSYHTANYKIYYSAKYQAAKKRTKPAFAVPQWV